MKLTSRELVLSGITAMVVLIGLSYWFGKPRLDNWRELGANREAVERRVQLAERVIGQKGYWDERLDALRGKVSVYPPDKDATADYLRILERVAKANNVNLVRRRARKEKSFGNLYELGIDCTWEAGLESLTRFMHALELENVTMNIDDLTIALVSGSKGKLKGDFSLICVYTRDAGLAESPAPQPEQDVETSE